MSDVLSLKVPSPRNRENSMEAPRYHKLRNNALDFLYNRFAHDDTE